MPRVVLECSARDQLIPEADFSLLHNRLCIIESEMRNAGASLEQRDRDCELLQYQLNDLRNSRSWKITAPLRAIADFVRDKSPKLNPAATDENKR